MNAGTLSRSSTMSMSRRGKKEKVRKFARAVEDFEGMDSEQLSFGEGDLIEVVEGDAKSMFHSGILRESQNFPITGEVKRYIRDCVQVTLITPLITLE